MTSPYSRAKIIDHTGSTLTLQLDEDGIEDNPSTPQSPPPSEETEDIERAIVEHGIPTREGDIGQDMGAHSTHFDLHGVCNLTDKGTLKAMAAKVQFTSSYPDGIMKIDLLNRDLTTVYSEDGLAIMRARFTHVGGLYKWYRWTITFGRYEGQTV